MKLSVAIPSGELYNEEIDSIVVSSKKYGEYGMLNSHLPIVSIIDYGYIKSWGCFCRENNDRWTGIATLNFKRILIRTLCHSPLRERNKIIIPT